LQEETNVLGDDLTVEKEGCSTRATNDASSFKTGRSSTFSDIASSGSFVEYFIIGIDIEHMTPLLLGSC
jgi:hypothetical protein